mmetsp:Transcript_86553/g.242405  ORF Transcript_86553/g.242405 Transcript_86553/m.242405 type:complete len:203 (+) Transcript_86553:1499-2107(+)
MQPLDVCHGGEEVGLAPKVLNIVQLTKHVLASEVSVLVNHVFVDLHCKAVDKAHIASQEARHFRRWRKSSQIVEEANEDVVEPRDLVARERYPDAQRPLRALAVRHGRGLRHACTSGWRRQELELWNLQTSPPSDGNNAHCAAMGVREGVHERLVVLANLRGDVLVLGDHRPPEVFGHLRCVTQPLLLKRAQVFEDTHVAHH